MCPTAQPRSPRCQSRPSLISNRPHPILRMSIDNRARRSDSSVGDLTGSSRIPRAGWGVCDRPRTGQEPGRFNTPAYLRRRLERSRTGVRTAGTMSGRGDGVTPELGSIEPTGGGHLRRHPCGLQRATALEPRFPCARATSEPHRSSHRTHPVTDSGCGWTSREPRLRRACLNGHHSARPRADDRRRDSWRERVSPQIADRARSDDLLPFERRPECVW